MGWQTIIVRPDTEHEGVRPKNETTSARDHRGHATEGCAEHSGQCCRHKDTAEFQHHGHTLTMRRDATAVGAGSKTALQVDRLAHLLQERRRAGGAK